jgi:hypothetical protein
MSNETTTTTLRAMLDPICDVTLWRFPYCTDEERAELRDGASAPHFTRAASENNAEAVGHNMLSGSDYNGGALVRSNRDAMLATLADIDDGESILLHWLGGYGSHSLLFMLDVPCSVETASAVAETLAALSDYPVLDEEALSEAEREDEEASWDSYACEDWRKAVDAASEGEYGFGLLTTEDADSDALREYFNACAEAGIVNGGPGIIHEETGACFLIDDAAEHVHPYAAAALGLLRIDAETALDTACSEDLSERSEARRCNRVLRIGRALRDALRKMNVPLYDWPMTLAGRTTFDPMDDPRQPIAADMPESILSVRVTFNRYDAKPAVFVLDPTRLTAWLEQDEAAQ